MTEPKRARTQVEVNFQRLTPRQRQVLEHVVAGRTTRQIADQLGVSSRTVEVHRAHVMMRMRADSVVQLVTMTLRHGLLHHLQ